MIGDFRFDIKWTAKNQDNDRIYIFVDTKNYSRASNMFTDLGQFKAYLEKIDNFDQLYIIQQGGRGVTREQIIRRLERVIVQDAEAVLKANETLWKPLNITSGIQLKKICENQGLSSGSHVKSFPNIVSLTY